MTNLKNMNSYEIVNFYDKMIKDGKTLSERERHEYDSARYQVELDLDNLSADVTGNVRTLKERKERNHGS